MSVIQKVLFFLVLPVIAALLYPPELLGGAGALLLVVVGLFVLIGFLEFRGSMQMLTFSIFVQGMNAIVRLMLFFQHTISKAGVSDVPFAVSCVLGIALSVYLVLRLDKSDVRVTMRV